MLRKVVLIHDLRLENGGALARPTIAYQQWGEPNADGSNIIWVCHALTGNSDVFDWWAGLFGDDALFNPKDYCIICPNTIGSCYGSTGPLSLNPNSGAFYFHDFPELTIRDMASAHAALANQLGIKQIGILIGGSLGGQQALEWAIEEPNRFSRLILVATNAQHSAWGVAFNESQRLAIENDPSWNQRHREAGINGLKTARSIALLSYRGYEVYSETQQRDKTEINGFSHPAISYQRYQGEKLAARFNAFSYWTLSKAMDSHDVSRCRDSLENALQQIQAKTLVIAIESDLLFPKGEQKFLAKNIRNAQYAEISSRYGHDGFLVETKAISKRISDFIQNDFNRYKIISFKTTSSLKPCKQL